MIHQADKDLKENWLFMFNSLPVDSRRALKMALNALRKDALIRAEYCWKRHKAPMALYWKVIGVYSGHLARAIKTDK